MTKTSLLVALVLGVSLTLPVAAKTYKWVDENGVTHIGDTIPPKYANKTRSELNKSGRVVSTTEVLTEEEQQAKKAADAEKAQEKEAKEAQQRYDKTLLNTYSNSDEIDLARKRNLQQVNARISSSTSRVRMANDNLKSLKDETAERVKAGKPIPASLKEDVAQAEDRLLNMQQQLEKYQAEKDALEARYDADKARYKILTGGR
ncbi:MAG: DUF4124 domain-containing protein [Pseudomonadota bacterium]